ncbi:MAG: hypothetical protein D4R79_00765 [Comamonadaceae bacterium]|nr:MAG: hypothetical protein D4R79_00765 [Comamonadaceae bacterium]
MRRVVAHGLAPDANDELTQAAQVAALQLLERSISFGHKRVSISRLSIAVQAGAEVSQEQWDYCHMIAVASRDLRIRTIYMEAIRRANMPVKYDLQSNCIG